MSGASEQELQEMERPLEFKDEKVQNRQEQTDEADEHRYRYGNHEDFEQLDKESKDNLSDYADDTDK